MAALVGGISPIIAVDRKAAAPLYAQIYAAYRARILAGELRAGQQIPSTRELAAELGISRIPVLDAYAQLLAEGYFESRVGSGTFVSSSLPDRRDARDDYKYKGRAVLPPAQSGPRKVAARAKAIPRYERPPWILHRSAFNLSQPALEAFPFRVWSNLVARYARELQVGALYYGNPMGLDELREAVAGYLRTARGVHCDTEQIMIVSGSQQAIDLSARVLLDPGEAVWLEEPGYWLIQNTLKAAQCRLLPVPVDEEGLDVAAGIRLSRKARAVYVAPSHEYPLGVTMGASRRLQLLAWAQSCGAWIIEDDYDSEYRYESMPVSSLQGLDRESRVIYIGTFSKVLFPSLRLGYIAIPPDLVNRFTTVRNATDICPSHLNQAVLADFIREGHFARHLRRMRRLYGERRSALVQSIRAEIGDALEIVGAEAGMHLCAIMRKGRGKSGRRDVELAVKAAREKLSLWPLSPCYLGRRKREGFILGFGNTPAEEIASAVRRLGALLRA
ncbi:MAG TPA: PLP-dependent aminotransferase family protein [Candidatus Acidoferrales bacterium]|nr:PLP-dependent aminotransferase family protein [Candidatus Acidoferrales bacterium]